MKNVPRDDLIRSTPMVVAQTEFLRADTIEGENVDGRTMVGYPIVFNQFTEIDSVFEGRFLERLHPGSVNRTLAQRGDQITIAFNHGFDPQIGDKPLGKASVIETRDYGLWVEVPLSRTSYNEDILALINDGALWGQSFRFSVKDERWNDNPARSDYNPEGIPERTIMEISLREMGPVTYPAYQASTLGIRSAAGYSSWIKDPTNVPTEALVQEDTAADSPPMAPARNIRLVRHRLTAAMGDITNLLERSNHHETVATDPGPHGRDQGVGS